jgi:hypothetical protein
MPPIRVHRRPTGWLLCLALAAAGCRTSESLEPPEAPALVAAEPLPVTLARSLRGGKAETSTFGKRRSFRVGALLVRLFPARDGAAYLSPVAADLETQWNEAAGEWEARYTFALALQSDGESHAIQAEGHGRSAAEPRAADREALEDCVGQIYAQVAALQRR